MLDQDRLLASTRAWAKAFASPMPDGIDDLLALATPNIRFADPFNDVRGHEALREILEDMVTRCENPSFEILDTAASDHAGYIRWVFRFVPKGSSTPWTLSGMSEIQCDETGLVVAHIDHWDSGSQFYAKLPALGSVVRWVRKRLSVTLPPR